MKKTTLNKIFDKHPCIDGWNLLLNNLNKTEPDDEELSLQRILESNGIIDAIWALRCIDECQEISLFMVEMIKFIKELIPENLANIFDVAEAYANGHITKEERREAWEKQIVVLSAKKSMCGSLWLPQIGDFENHYNCLFELETIRLGTYATSRHVKTSAYHVFSTICMFLYYWSFKELYKNSAANKEYTNKYIEFLKHCKYAYQKLFCSV